MTHVSLEEAEPEVRDPKGWNPSAVWDEAWKRTLLTRALAQLEEDLTSAGRAEIFRLFRRYYLQGEESFDYRALAAQTTLSLGEVARRLHEARCRYREILMRLVSQTTADAEEMRAEFRELFGTDPT